jgi:hypothetical protein
MAKIIFITLDGLACIEESKDKFPKIVIQKAFTDAVAKQVGEDCTESMKMTIKFREYHFRKVIGDFYIYEER